MHNINVLTLRLGNRMYTYIVRHVYVLYTYAYVNMRIITTILEISRLPVYRRISGQPDLIPGILYIVIRRGCVKNPLAIKLIFFYVVRMRNV